MRLCALTSPVQAAYDSASTSERQTTVTCIAYLCLCVGLAQPCCETCSHSMYCSL
jgi:hypothetical protein